MHQNDNIAYIALCFEDEFGESSEDDKIIPELEDVTMVEFIRALPGQ